MVAFLDLLANYYLKGRQIFEVYEASCFGWIVDAGSTRTVAFGGDPLYLGMKNNHPSQLKSASTDYGSLIHSQLMLRKTGGTGLDLAKARVIKEYNAEGTKKTVLRRLLRDILLESLRECITFLFAFFLLIKTLCICR